MRTYHVTNYANSKGNITRRVRWVYDEDYNPRGSFAYETEEETKQAEDETIAKLNSGEWVALGAIYETAANGCQCPECPGWHHKDSLWGIVIDGTDKALSEFAKNTFDL